MDGRIVSVRVPLVRIGRERSSFNGVGLGSAFLQLFKDFGRCVRTR